MEFKDKSSIIIYNIFGFEQCSDIDEYGIDEYIANENYIKIHGEFFYCEQLLDGRLIVTEDFINDLIKKISFKLNVIKSNTIYTIIDQESLAILRKMKLFAEFVTIENFQPDNDDDDFEDDYDEDEEYIFFNIKSIKK